MSETALQKEKIVAALEGLGIRAMGSYPQGERKLSTSPFVLVSLEKMEREPLGFRHYLGEKVSADGKSVVEMYGGSVGMTFSLLVHGPKALGAGACETLVETLTEKLFSLDLGELSLGSLSWEGLYYDREKGCFCQKAMLDTKGTLYALVNECGVFETFDVKGGMSLE